jgi:hypothetical protein
MNGQFGADLAEASHQFTQAGIGIPVEVAQILALAVLAEIGELARRRLARAAVFADRAPGQRLPRPNRQTFQPSPERGVEEECRGLSAECRVVRSLASRLNVTGKPHTRPSYCLLGTRH